MTKDEALEKAIDIAESWIRDQLEGTGMFNEAIKELAPLKEALAQPEHEKERCVGCEACIDTACGRDECPKGWPKAAQPEQEPVAWADHGVVNWIADKQFKHAALLYEAPQRTWVGLTDEEILSWWSMDNGLEDLDMCNIVHFRKFVEEVEAKLKKKNT